MYLLHKESGPCNYRELCECKYCMYNHTKNKFEEDDFKNDNIRVDTKEDDELIEDDEIDSESEDVTDNVENDAEDDVANRTFLNPSQSEDSDNSTSSAKNIKCEMCDSKFANKSYLRKHKEEIHY